MTHAKPQITIGMPVHDGNSYLEDAVRSLLAQTWRDFELLIIDDGSSDASPQICEAFAQADPRVIFERHERNRGMTATFLELLSRASGTFFMWAGQDDLWDSDFLSEGIRLLKANPHAIGYMPAMRLEDEGGNEIATTSPPRELASDDPVLRAEAVHRGGYHAVYALYRRSALLGDVPLADIPGTDCAFVFSMALRGPYVVSNALRSFRRGIGYHLVPGPRERLVNAKALGPSGHLFSRNPNPMTASMLRATWGSDLPSFGKARLTTHILVVWWAIRWRLRFLSDSTYRIERAVYRHAYLDSVRLFVGQALLSPRAAAHTARVVVRSGRSRHQ